MTKTLRAEKDAMIRELQLVVEHLQRESSATRALAVVRSDSAVEAQMAAAATVQDEQVRTSGASLTPACASLFLRLPPSPLLCTRGLHQPPLRTGWDAVPRSQLTLCLALAHICCIGSVGGGEPLTAGGSGAHGLSAARCERRGAAGRRRQREALPGTSFTFALFSSGSGGGLRMFAGCRMWY